MKKQVDQHPSDPYWGMVSFLLTQLRGLADGYNSARGASELALTETAMFVMSLLDADMDDLITAIAEREGVRDERLHRHRPRPKERRGRCSALVQLAFDYSDLWVSHDDWDEYRSMMKIVKYLSMPLPDASGVRIVMTSHPGNIYSADDFYQISTGMTVVETSIENYNKSLWMNVKPESLFTPLRAMVANRLGTDGESWTKYQVTHNSGTSNKQWIVVDYKLFQPGEDFLSNTVWISETMPGHFQRADVSNVVMRQFDWPSYNVPYFREIWEIAGNQAMIDEALRHGHPKQADSYSYTKAPRALMFARARHRRQLVSLDAFMKLMRSNNLNDPLLTTMHA